MFQYEIPTEGNGVVQVIPNEMISDFFKQQKFSAFKKFLTEIGQNFINKINTFLLNKSWQAALAQAKKINSGTGKKVWIILLHGEFLAIPKQEFKIMWQRNPKMKCKTIAQWQKTVYEYEQQS